MTICILLCIQEVFFQYWHDPIHLDEYIEKSQFIAEINNEKEVKNKGLTAPMVGHVGDGNFHLQ